MPDTLIPNGQLIVFNFPAGAGGKMLQNCVGLSRHCVLSHTDYIRWQLDYQNDFNPSFYRQKLEWILKTVPDHEQIHNWLAYEIDKDDPPGFNFMGYRQGKKITNIDYYLLAEQGLWATAVVHNYGSAKYFVNYWPHIKQVSLVNNKQFACQALTLKNVNLTYDQDWDQQGSTPSDRCFNFDIDGTIYDQDKFLNQVGELYAYLGFGDFQRDTVKEYYNKYINAHL